MASAAMEEVTSPTDDATSGFGSEWESQMREVFAIYDKTGSKTIESSELADALRSCGLRLTHAQCNKLKAEAEKEADDIDFELFKRLLYKGSEMQISDTDISHAFELFIDEKGFIEVEKMKHALMTLGDVIKEAEIDILFRDAGFDEADPRAKLHYTKLLALIQSSAAVI